MYYLLIISMIIVAYLFGSLSGAIIVSQIMHLPNPRYHGSQNPGATNMLRISGVIPALIVLIIDMLKGMIPVLISYRMGIAPMFLGFIGIAACLGHMYPCFFKFQGGKGVATAFGTMAAIGWDFAGAFSVTWLLATWLSGYSSIGAIVSFTLAPGYVWLFKPELTLPVSMLSCMILARHIDNIQRLLQGKEYKIGKKS